MSSSEEDEELSIMSPVDDLPGSSSPLARLLNGGVGCALLLCDIFFLKI